MLTRQKFGKFRQSSRACEDAVRVYFDVYAATLQNEISYTNLLGNI
jgi:hypothetical protein